MMVKIHLPNQKIDFVDSDYMFIKNMRTLDLVWWSTMSDFYVRTVELSQDGNEIWTEFAHY